MSATAKVIAGIAAVVVLLVGFWLARPLFVDDVVDEEFPAAVQPAQAGEPVIPAGMSAEEVEEEMSEAAAAPDVVEEEEMPGTEPIAVVSGSFAGADESHQGSGTATIYEVDGASVLRLEDFSVTNGPDLRVYLAPLDGEGYPDIDAGTSLGRLKGNIGNQNYDIPADVDLSADLAVVIWCEPFRVTFAVADLA